MSYPEGKHRCPNCYIKMNKKGRIYVATYRDPYATPSSMILESRFTEYCPKCGIIQQYELEVYERK